MHAEISPSVSLKLRFLTRRRQAFECVDTGPIECSSVAGSMMVDCAVPDVTEVNNGINLVPTTVKNPQANAICERVYQTIGDTLRTMLLIHPPNDILDANESIDSDLVTTMHATRTSSNRSLINNSTVQELLPAFHRDRRDSGCHLSTRHARATRAVAELLASAR
jgi:hypothetical protein